MVEYQVLSVEIHLQAKRHCVLTGSCICIRGDLHDTVSLVLCDVDSRNRQSADSTRKLRLYADIRFEVEQSSHFERDVDALSLLDGRRCRTVNCWRTFRLF